ncbi:hypothetical protein [Botrimarina colliarenosi]|uniref:hypothetical protein n=1 Tax=Botrimarina colliarenosi TaxID=2528001 RepID=UPI0018D289BF|nr:hypothetical protein [Botrimarina colliarenosi]
MTSFRLTLDGAKRLCGEPLRRLVRLATLSLLLAPVAAAQQPSVLLLRRLATPATLHWRDVPTRDALRRFAAETATPLWIDRRTDPRTTIDLSSNGEPIAALLDAIAAEAGLGVAAIDGIVYVGPADAAAALPRLAEQWRQGAPRGMRRANKMDWPRLTSPKQLVEQIAAEAGCQLANPEAIPHDLWPAGSTPRLAAGDRLTLVALGFGLRWTRDASDANTIRLEPLEAASQEPPASLASLLKSDDGVVGESRYSIRVVEQPVVPVLRQLANQLGRQLRVSDALNDPNQRASFEVRQATLEELLAAIGEAAGLDVSATDEEIRVSPR